MVEFNWGTKYICVHINFTPDKNVGYVVYLKMHESEFCI